MSLISNQKLLGSQPTRLRQIALVARDLEKARHLLATVIGTEVIFEDPAVGQWGLKNILVPIGGDIIEVVSPFRTDTPASRQLARRGDGGYMIIMQTLDAAARRKYIESKKLAKVIFSHELEESICIQYHPKGIKGGMMPELDSHNESQLHPDPLNERFSPWHAAGPPSSYSTYSAGMRKHGNLHLLSATLRLSPEDKDTSAAATQWHEIFGVQRGKGNGRLQFTNATISFVCGESGKNDGLVEVTIGVEGKQTLHGILENAKKEGLKVDGECVHMLGLNWRFALLDNGPARSQSML